ncbi:MULTISPECIES: hypothetical protein [unclassified Paenibacillus]|nr:MULTISPECIES: hypothetical protein [unclassified Paenibacillus]
MTDFFECECWDADWVGEEADKSSLAVLRREEAEQLFAAQPLCCADEGFG